MKEVAQLCKKPGFDITECVILGMPLSANIVAMEWTEMGPLNPGTQGKVPPFPPLDTTVGPVTGIFVLLKIVLG